MSLFTVDQHKLYTLNDCKCYNDHYVKCRSYGDVSLMLAVRSLMGNGWGLL